MPLSQKMPARKVTVKHENLRPVDFSLIFSRISFGSKPMHLDYEGVQYYGIRFPESNLMID